MTYDQKTSLLKYSRKPKSKNLLRELKIVINGDSTRLAEKGLII